MAASGIDPCLRVTMPAAVPLYVLLEWNKKVPKGQRSAVLTSLLCRHLMIPQLVEEEGELTA